MDTGASLTRKPTPFILTSMCQRVWLISICLLVAFRAGAESGSIRFADVDFRLFTTGDRQAHQELGSFQAALPLGKAGRLVRRLTVRNETRGRSLTLDIRLELTPTLARDGYLHCLVLSDATPEQGRVASRIRDLIFIHPGEQVMEIYADPGTGIHLFLAIQCHLPEVPEVEERPRWPMLQFSVRVEQWTGARRVELETLELHSLDGCAVTHDFERKVPRWEEGAVSPEEDPLARLPVLDLSEEKPTVEAGQGFTIVLPDTAEQPEMTTPDQKPPKRRGRDSRLPAPVPRSTPPEEPESPKHIEWSLEEYHLSLTPVRLEKANLVLEIGGEGSALDPSTHQPVPLSLLTVRRSLAPGEPSPFYLTREHDNGTMGFVFWVTPNWRFSP